MTAQRSASERQAGERAAGICFVVSFLASLSFALAVAFGLRTQIEGAALSVALAGLAIGAVVWALHALPREQVEDMREIADTGPNPPAAAGRTTFLVRTSFAALGALGIATLFPYRALAPAFGDGLYRTKWRAGSRVVRADGSPLRPIDLEAGSVMTVYPEGAVGDVSSATLLLRLSWQALRASTSPGAWMPDGCVAFSKLCTHAGCPVGVYRQSTQQLLCPCHQSVFDVMRAAMPVSGPATRALPQLPLTVGPDGFLRSSSDYLEPVGPGFWNRS